MTIVQKIIDLTQSGIQEAILRMESGDTMEICKVPAGSTVDLQDGKLIVTYDDGEEMLVTIEIGENNG